MQLTLSTEAAPDLALGELLEACARRGIAALELVEGHAHGVSPESNAEVLAHVRGEVASVGGRIAAFRVDSVERATSPATAALGAALCTSIVAPASADAVDDEIFLRAAELYAAEGITLLIEHGAQPARVERLRQIIEAAPEGALGLAWDVDPEDAALATSTAAVLRAAGPHLKHVRLRGGGPEAAGQEGRGIGPLMARLTLAAYDGTLALAPSTPRYRFAWGAWLGRHGGWGCGSKRADASLVTLDLDNGRRR